MARTGKLRQRTVSGQTLTLHKLKNPIPEVEDTPYLYEVRIDGKTDEEQFYRGEADDAFERAIRHLEMADERDRDRGGPQDDYGYAGDVLGMNNGGGGGLFGGW